MRWGGDVEVCEVEGEGGEYLSLPLGEGVEAQVFHDGLSLSGYSGFVTWQELAYILAHMEPQARRLIS